MPFRNCLHRTGGVAPQRSQVVPSEAKEAYRLAGRVVIVMGKRYKAPFEQHALDRR